MRKLILFVLLIVGLGIAQPGYWGPGIWADFLQGKDTTALFNAKTLQGKDTTALFDSLRFVKGGGRSCVITGANAWAAGLSDTASGAYSGVGAGKGNKASGDSSYVGGGVRNKATSILAVIGGGYNNTLLSSAYNAQTIGGGSNNSITTSNRGTIAGGGDNSITGSQGTIAGGKNNIAGADAAIAGGSYNTASGSSSAIAGGSYNTASGLYSAIGGGGYNNARGGSSFIPGGIANLDSAPYSFALGCSLRVPAADSFSGVIGHGAGAERLVGSGKRTITMGVGTPGYVSYYGSGAADSTRIFKALRIGSMRVGDTVMVRTAGTAFAATTRFQTYADSCAGVDSIQLTALNSSGARARVITLRDSVFVKDGATVVKILDAAGKWCDLEYLGAPCSRWQVFGSN